FPLHSGQRIAEFVALGVVELDDPVGAILQVDASPRGRPADLTDVGHLRAPFDEPATPLGISYKPAGRGRPLSPPCPASVAPNAAPGWHRSTRPSMTPVGRRPRRRSRESRRAPWRGA